MFNSSMGRTIERCQKTVRLLRALSFITEPVLKDILVQKNKYNPIQIYSFYRHSDILRRCCIYTLSKLGSSPRVEKMARIFSTTSSVELQPYEKEALYNTIRNFQCYDSDFEFNPLGAVDFFNIIPFKHRHTLNEQAVSMKLLKIIVLCEKETTAHKLNVNLSWTIPAIEQIVYNNPKWLHLIPVGSGCAPVLTRTKNAECLMSKVFNY